MVTFDFYDYKLQTRPYEFNNALVSCEGSYDASKKVLNEEIYKVKISWKTSYLATRRTSHCGSNVLKNGVRIGKFDA